MWYLCAIPIMSHAVRVLFALSFYHHIRICTRYSRNAWNRARVAPSFFLLSAVSPSPKNLEVLLFIVCLSLSKSQTIFYPLYYIIICSYVNFYRQRIWVTLIPRGTMTMLRKHTYLHSSTYTASYLGSTLEDNIARALLGKSDDAENL